MSEKYPLLPVILAGGAGTRLWPLSRQSFPKQFLPVLGDQTLLQQTVGRVDVGDTLKPLVLCNTEHRFLVAEQLRSCGVEPLGIVLEPVARNTAPAIALAAFYAVAMDVDPVMLVLASDHHIPDEAALRGAIEQGRPVAEGGALITFGVTPTHPETQYGYIRLGDADQGVPRVAEFVEKPDLATAKEYLEAGGYVWNSGMFMFRASVFLAELERYAPETHAICSQAVSTGARDQDFFRPDPCFLSVPEDSVDYAIMERTQQARVVALDAGWSDVGNWRSLWSLVDRDAQGNSTRGDVLAVGTKNSLIRAESRLVATIGLEDVVIVETSDAVLVARKDGVHRVREVVAALGERPEVRIHARVPRPWGAYETLDVGGGYLVKRISIDPGASISLQRHQHRSEHWVVIRGNAVVEREGERFDVKTNESAYIPVGSKHRLTNPTDGPLELIEVQVGDWLDEDDIERFADDYGR